MDNCRDSSGVGKPQSFFFSLLRLGSHSPFCCEYQQGSQNSPPSTWLPIYSLQAAVVICECVACSKTCYILAFHTPSPVCRELSWSATHLCPPQSGVMLLLTRHQTGYSPTCSRPTSALSWMRSPCPMPSATTVSSPPGLHAVFILHLSEEAIHLSLKTDADFFLSISFL